ncbi:MAG TPA: hypothetical protein VGQ18_15850 [Gemmatimonadales bacterium]|jgi:hypothetical protein|nr:hypothetical protein [Gemmatimonadales bacterium]
MRSRIARLVVQLSFFAPLIGCARQTVDLVAARAEVLKTVDSDNADLIRSDTAAIRAEVPEGDTVYSVMRGQIFRTTRANALEGYDFEKIRYTAATPLDSPIVHLSPDGRVAWIIARYRYSYVEKNAAGVEHPGELTIAWLVVYQKRGARWVGMALAQTFPSTSR